MCFTIQLLTTQLGAMTSTMSCSDWVHVLLQVEVSCGVFQFFCGWIVRLTIVRVHVSYNAGHGLVIAVGVSVCTVCGQTNDVDRFMVWAAMLCHVRLPG